MTNERVITRKQTRDAMRAAFAECGAGLGESVTDEMAVPAYLQRGLISHTVFWRKLHFVLRAAQLKPGTRIFDFGCGTGVLLPTLCAAGRSVQATDLHLELARNLIARLGLERIELLAADEWPSRVQDDSIDTIIAANVLEHIEDRPALLTRFGQMLTKTGRLVISGPTENALYRLGRRLIGFSGDYHVTTIREILEDARRAGLRRVYLKHWPAPGPLCLYRIAAFQRPA